MPVGAGVNKEAPHADENTGLDADPPIAFRSDRRPSVLAGWINQTSQSLP